MTNPAVTLHNLGSGSRGNASVITHQGRHLLVDCGFTRRQIVLRMQAMGLDPAGIAAILVSHEHSDHVKGVGIMARRYDLPVYITRKTEKAAASRLGKLSDVRHFVCGTGFTIRTLSVHPFSTSHDAQDPAGFTPST